MLLRDDQLQRLLQVGVFNTTYSRPRTRKKYDMMLLDTGMNDYEFVALIVVGMKQSGYVWGQVIGVRCLVPQRTAMFMRQEPVQDK